MREREKYFFFCHSFTGTCEKKKTIIYISEKIKMAGIPLNYLHGLLLPMDSLVVKNLDSKMDGLGFNSKSSYKVDHTD